MFKQERAKAVYLKKKVVPLTLLFPQASHRTKEEAEVGKRRKEDTKRKHEKERFAFGEKKKKKKNSKCFPSFIDIDQKQW